jgi:hypothetical protein
MPSADPLADHQTVKEACIAFLEFTSAVNPFECECVELIGDGREIMG